MILAIPLFTTLQDSLISSTGSGILVVIGIFGVLLVGFMFAGIPFKFALMFTMPVVYGATVAFGLPSWVEGIFWFFVIGFGLFMAWTMWTRT